MIHYIEIGENGRITNAGSTGNTTREKLQKYLTDCIITSAFVDPFKNYWDGVSVVSFPEKPSDLHYFDYVTKSWKIDEVSAWIQVTSRRNELLASTDWTQLPDIPEATKATWTSYRQALRDITTQLDPANIVWPTPPI